MWLSSHVTQAFVLNEMMLHNFLFALAEMKNKQLVLVSYGSKLTT
jgi:hypothetical protein